MFTIDGIKTDASYDIICIGERVKTIYAVRGVDTIEQTSKNIKIPQVDLSDEALMKLALKEEPVNGKEWRLEKQYIDKRCDFYDNKFHCYVSSDYQHKIYGDCMSVGFDYVVEQ